MEGGIEGGRLFPRPFVVVAPPVKTNLTDGGGILS